jgi:hypothetical protein
MLFKIKSFALKYSLLILFIAVQAPFVLNTFYNYPAADDFCYASFSKHDGFFSAQQTWYNGWSGRYFASALLSLNPIIVGWNDGYKFIALALFVSLNLVLYFLLNYISGKKLSKVTVATLSFGMAFLYLFKMPTVVEGFYWLAGALTYQVSVILSILLILLVLKQFDENTKHKNILLVLSSVLIAAICGSNETIMVILTLVLASATGLNFIKSKKINFRLSILTIVSIVSSLIVYFAPGNAVRQAAIGVINHDLKYSIKESLIQTLSYFYDWVTNSPILILSIFFIPIAKIIYDRNASIVKKLYINPILSSALLIGLVAVSFFTGYFGAGIMIPIRAINITYIVFLVMWFYNLFNIVCFFEQRKKFNFNAPPFYVLAGLFVLLILFIPKSYNIRLAARDFVKGDSYQYAQEWNQRFNLIDNCKKEGATLCEVPLIKRRPPTLFFGDITPDTKDWVNVCVTSFYRIGDIKAIP